MSKVVLKMFRCHSFPAGLFHSVPQATVVKTGSQKLRRKKPLPFCDCIIIFSEEHNETEV